MTCRYYQRAPLPKVGSVLHQLDGAGAQEYVRVEDYCRTLEERNALQATVEWQADKLFRLRVGSWVLAVVMVLGWAV